MAEPRYIQNDMPLRELPAPASALLQTALEEFMRANPPKSTFESGELFGLFGGLTGLAYMLLQLSELHPNVTVKGKGLRQWAQLYLGNNDRSEVEIVPSAGLFNEKLSYDAVRACLTGKGEDVKTFLSNFSEFTKELPAGEEDEFPSEILYGRAGGLYLLRAVRHWVPAYREELNEEMERVAEKIMEANGRGQDSWIWNKARFTGAAHGDIGIITQLVLCLPALAAELEPQVRKLLSMQSPNGNWPKYTDKEEAEPDVVQFCHGSPGFIYSLRALRSFYPHLQEEMDIAIVKGEENIWKEGLIRKAPALCHGIPGNAL